MQSFLSVFINLFHNSPRFPLFPPIIIRTSVVSHLHLLSFHLNTLHFCFISVRVLLFVRSSVSFFVQLWGRSRFSSFDSTAMASPSQLARYICIHIPRSLSSSIYDFHLHLNRMSCVLISKARAPFVATGNSSQTTLSKGTTRL